MNPFESAFFNTNPISAKTIELLDTSMKETGISSHSLRFPAMVNAHSHAFQFAMAGQAEYFSGESDNFWSWREKMYDLATTMTPHQMGIVAERCFHSLKARGYSTVCEFLYLHFFDSASRRNLNTEMAESLIRAAKKVELNLCLVPVYYNQGGFGKAPSEKQKNFCFDSLSHYLEYVEKLNLLCTQHGVTLGWGLHSLRAATANDSAALLKLSLAHPTRPFHMHISEQVAEVEQCIQHLGARPVEWLKTVVELGPQHNFVHATHLSESELSFLASSKATVVLCPTTEASLGDGFFPFYDFVKQGGKFAIGSDSQIGLSPFEELRWLDYQTRLTRKARNLFGDKGDFQARWLWQKALDGGRKAAGIFDNTHGGATIQAYAEKIPANREATDDEIFSRFFYQR